MHLGLGLGLVAIRTQITENTGGTLLLAESGDDIQGTLDIAVEVKARTGFSPLAAIRQMQARRTSALPFAVLRMDGTGESTIDDWPVVVRLEDMVALLRAAGYGDTPKPPPTPPRFGP